MRMYRRLWLLAAVAVFASTPSSAASVKKGYCLTPRKHPDWAQQLRALNAKWFYTWGPSPPAGAPEGLEFVPMIWGYGLRAPAAIDKIIAQKAARPFTHLLGFNEPDSKKQANLSVERAIAAWPRLMQTGLRLGSPAAVAADKDWMRQFMAEAEKRKYRVDFITVHWYGGANADSFIARLKRVHKLYKRPIWITEFGVADWKATKKRPNRHTPERVYRFMQKALPALERIHFVERYAWFCAKPTSLALGPCALFDEKGRLTELGKLYASF